MNQASRRLPALLAAVGLLLSAALEVVHVRAYVAPSARSFCTVGPQLDCSTVALSRWSVFLGIPVPLWGVAGFLTIGLLAWWRSRWFLAASAAAALASLALLAIEVLAIHSVCLLCEGVHLTSWALFAVAWRERHLLTQTEGITVAHILTVPIGILVGAYSILSPYWAVFSWKNGVQLPHGIDAEGHYWVGAEEPKVVLHEYTDYACAHCAAATSLVRRRLAEHPSSLRVVHHNYPRMRCPTEVGSVICIYARAANCAGEQGKFWEMDSWLFAHVPGTITKTFEAASKDLGMDDTKLSACLASPASFERADAEALAALRTHIIDAPSYVIDGKRYVGGEVFPVLRNEL